MALIQRNYSRAAARCFVGVSTKTRTSIEKQCVLVDWQAIKANSQHGETPLTSGLLEATVNLGNIVGHHEYFTVLIHGE